MCYLPRFFSLAITSIALLLSGVLGGACQRLEQRATVQPAWECSYCTFDNENEAQEVCEMCALPRGAAAQVTPPNSVVEEEEEKQAQCDEINTERLCRRRCKQCNNLQNVRLSCFVCDFCRGELQSTVAFAEESEEKKQENQLTQAEILSRIMGYVPPAVVRGGAMAQNPAALIARLSLVDEAVVGSDFLVMPPSGVLQRKSPTATQMQGGTTTLQNMTSDSNALVPTQTLPPVRILSAFADETKCCETCGVKNPVTARSCENNNCGRKFRDNTIPSNAVAAMPATLSPVMEQEASTTVAVQCPGCTAYHCEASRQYCSVCVLASQERARKGRAEMMVERHEEKSPAPSPPPMR